MQRVVPFLHTPLEAPEFLELWRETIRSGVARASEATAGSAGWMVSVRAGEVIIDGSWIYDDLDKIDGLDLGHVGGDAHYAVYQTYAYAGSDPPATSVFAVSGAVSPPAQPTIPAGAVKLCDIFVPAAAGSIGTVPGINQQDPVQVSTTGVRFVQAPRLWPVQDTGELMDRLIMSVGNTLLFSQGAITFDDTAGLLYLSQPVVVQTLCSTHRQFFNNAPAIVRTTVPAAPAGLAVPGTAGSRDVIVYTLVDRSSPNTALAGTIRFLDRTAPGAPELLELLDSTKRTQLVILGVINGARMFMPGVVGQIPEPVADVRRFMKNDPGGAHTWELLDDMYFLGGLKAGLANSAARDAIAADLRKQGLVAYTQDDDTFFTLAGGVTNGDWVQLFDDNRLAGGLRSVADTTARDAIPTARRKEGMVVYSLADNRYYLLEGGVTNSDWLDLHDDARFRGGLRVVADATARDAIPANQLKIGMVVINVALSTLEQLVDLVPTWRTICTVGTDSLSTGTVTATTQVITPTAAIGGNAIQAFESNWLRGLSGSSQTAAVRRARVMQGLELIPEVVLVSGTDYTFRFRVKPGIAGFPSGAVIRSTADLTVAGNLAASYIGGVLPSEASFPQNIYAYLRHDDPGDVPDALRLSTSAPDAQGRPGAADATFTVDQYCYVGMLRPISRLFDALSDPEWPGVWGYGAITHLAEGLREVMFSDEAALEVSGSEALNSGDEATFAMTPATNLLTLFPTARAIIVAIWLRGSPGGTLSAFYEFFSQGLYAQVICESVAGMNKNVNLVSRIPNRADRAYIKAIAYGGYTGPAGFNYRTKIVGIVEDVNAPIGTFQATFDPVP